MEIKSYNSAQPSFGMWRFEQGGANRMAKAFKDCPDKAKKIVSDVFKLEDVEVVASHSELKVIPNRYQEFLGDFLRAETAKRDDERLTLLAKTAYENQPLVSEQFMFSAIKQTAEATQAEINRLTDELEPLATELRRVAETGKIDI